MKHVLAASVVLALFAGALPASEDVSLRGGDGGAGGDGAVIPIPEVSTEKLEAYVKTLTAKQLGQLEEMISLEREEGQAELTPQAKAHARTVYLKWMVVWTEVERAKYWAGLPVELDHARRRRDPSYVSDADKKAAAALPVEVKAQAKAMLSDDVNEYLQARKVLAHHGIAAAPLLAEVVKELKDGTYKQTRVLSLLRELQNKEVQLLEQLLRVADEALKRRDEFQTTQKGEARIAVLVSRRLISSARRELPIYGDLCYFSFPRNRNDYKGQVSLTFDNGGEPNMLGGRMYGGQLNQLKDLGAVEFESIKSAPSAATTRTWTSECSAEPGHVYLEHCKEDREQLDACYKFKVLELKSDNYVIIEWTPIPQNK